ncbi:MAG: sigma-70 family RNA polymerase sigma factor [Ignavibacteriales bacterium]|nr:sigma-70 family RNA polymerase sigma factor [Ignavibacteriales bacterium]
MSDEKLMSLIAKKDTKAFSSLYDRYSVKMLFFFTRMYNGNNEKAQDAVQDLFMKLVDFPERFDVSRKFSSWFYSVAANMCKNEYRRYDNKKADQIDEEFLSVDSLGTEELFDLSNFRDDLYQALASLSYEHRESFILRYANDFSVKEIAAIVNCPEGTAKSRIFYTLKFLSRKLAIYNPKQEKDHET